MSITSVGAELAGELEARRHRVDGDHPVRAHLLGHRARVQAQAAGALHHHVVAEAQRVTSRPQITWLSAQLAPAAISSLTASGTLKIFWRDLT